MKSFSKLKLSTLSALCVMLCIAVLAVSGEAKTLKIKTSPNGKTKYDSKTRIGIIEGGLTITYDDATIIADKAEYVNAKDGSKMESIVLTGNVKLTKTDLSLTGTKFTMRFKDNIVVAEGNVTLVKNDTADSKQDSDPITLKCGKLEMHIEKKDATATGNVIVTKKDMKAWSDKAVYLETQKQMTLTGGVKLEGSKGEKISCNELIVSTNSDTFEAKGEISIEMTVEDETNTEKN